MSYATQGGLTVDDLPKLRNVPVIGSDGEEIGHVGDAYYDEQTGQLEYIGIEGDWLGLTKKVVPAQGAQLREDDKLYLQYGRGEVGGAPDFEGDEMDDAYLEQLRSHYQPQTPAAGVGPQTPTADADVAVTRAEEELAVGKREVPAGAVRLRKWVETEPVQIDVELRRETARVTREPIDQPVTDADFGEQEVEVELRGEQPVVAKEAVAKERIGIEKDVAVDRQTVSDEVRKEHVEVDGDFEEQQR